MSKVRRPCIDCGRLCEPGQSRCRTHRSTELRRRKKAGLTGKRGSTAEWRALRARIITRDGDRCIDCGKHALDLPMGERLEVDHEDGDPSNNAETNLGTRCTSCHQKVERIRQGGK